MRTIIGTCVVTVLAGAACAQTAFYQRATQGTTGNNSGGGLAVDSNFYCGWRFEVTNGPIQTVDIGGHFFAGEGTVFGALVALSGPNDDPDPIDMTGPDVLGTTLVTLPPSAGGSQPVQGPLSLTLQNGWYLVVFGAGRYGATTGGASLFAQDPSTAVPGVQLNITYRQPTSPFGSGVFLQGSVARVFVEYSTGAPCYANCDQSTAPPVLNVQDFSCFLTRYASGDSYANCDQSTAPPVLNVQDFSCFLTKYASGCP
jgi:hypothetical protein